MTGTPPTFLLSCYPIDLFFSLALAVRLARTALSPPAGLPDLEFPGFCQYVHQCYELLFGNSVIVDAQPREVNPRLLLCLHNS